PGRTYGFGGAGKASRPIVPDGARTIVALAMLQQHRFDLRMAVEERNQLRAAIAVKSDNSNRRSGHFLDVFSMPRRPRIPGSGTLFADRAVGQLPQYREVIILVVVDLYEHEDPGPQDHEMQELGNAAEREPGAGNRKRQHGGDHPFDHQPRGEQIQTLE